MAHGKTLELNKIRPPMAYEVVVDKDGKKQAGRPLYPLEKPKGGIAAQNSFHGLRLLADLQKHYKSVREGDSPRTVSFYRVIKKLRKMAKIGRKTRKMNKIKAD